MKRTPRILVVDDDTDDQLLLHTAFKKTAPTSLIQFVSDGTELLQLVRTNQYLPDLIVLDLYMPGMGGLTALAHLKQVERYKAVPVIVLTASSSASDINRAYELGASTFITKPASHQALVDVMERISTYWLKLSLLAADQLTTVWR